VRFVSIRRQAQQDIQALLRGEQLIRNRTALMRGCRATFRGWQEQLQRSCAGAAMMVASTMVPARSNCVAVPLHRRETSHRLAVVVDRIRPAGPTD
jgi:hypothetical protein